MHGRSLLLALCLATALAAPASAKQIDLDAQDSGTQITLRPGDTARITLDSNPSTGYSWDVTRRPDKDVARIQSSSYEPPAQALPGAGGIQVYVLRARRSGRTTFRTLYQQVGSGDRGDTFDLRLRVKRR